MNIKVTGKNIEITDAIREYIEKRCERLEKFEGKNTDVNVVCSIEREDQIVEIQINHDGEFLRVEEKNADLYASIDLAMDRAERQLRKEKEKIRKKQLSIADKFRKISDALAIKCKKAQMSAEKDSANIEKKYKTKDIMDTMPDSAAASSIF